MHNENTSILSYLLLIPRLLPGILIFPHGFRLANDYHNSIDWLTDNEFGLPIILAYCVIIIQLYAVLFLALGLASRYQAISILLLTIGSLSYHFNGGIDVDLMGLHAENGMIFYILLFICCMIIITTGGGKFSTDRFLSKAFNKTSTYKNKI